MRLQRRQLLLTPRASSWHPQTKLYARVHPRHSKWPTSRRMEQLQAPERVQVSSLRQREHGECSAKRRVVAQRSVAADRAEAVGRIGQAGCKADTRPAADAGKHRDILPAALF